MGRISDSVARVVGETCLSFVEKLPRFRDSLIGDLQIIREYQRTHANEAFQKTRAPDGCSLEYLYFRLLEAYTIEEFGRLWTHLRDMFPDLRDGFQSASFQSWFARLSNNITGAGTIRVGVISGTQSSFIRPLVRQPHFPHEVDLIEIWLHKVIPSLFVVAFDVHLTKTATDQLLALHGKRYLSRVRFSPLIPFSRRRLSHSENTSEAEMRSAVIRWMSGLQYKVEECLGPLAGGFFSRSRKHQTARLPRMEMYAVSGLCASYDNPGVREERTRTLRWLETLGLSVTTLVYRNNGALFMLPTADEEEDTAAYQMCVDPVPYLQGVNTTAFGGSENAICYRSGQTFDVLTASVTILEMLRDIQRSVEQIKRAAFFVMSPFRRRTRRRMRDYFAVAGSLGWQATVFSGLETDLQFVASKLKADLEPIKDLKPAILWSDGSLPGTLQDRLTDSMNRHLAVLGKHITQIQRALGEHLVVRNMDAMYLLQRWVVVLAVVVTAATIVGVYFGWRATLKSGP